jgi:hypothetical protein
MLTSIINTIVDLGKKVIPRFVPDKNAAQQMEHELKTALLEEAAKENSDFRKFMLAYEGAASEHGWFIKWLRGSVRPVLTYIFAGLFIASFLNYVPVSNLRFDMLYKILMIVLAFWFGERAVKNVLPFIGDAMGKRNGGAK